MKYKKSEFFLLLICFSSTRMTAAEPKPVVLGGLRDLFSSLMGPVRRQAKMLNSFIQPDSNLLEVGTLDRLSQLGSRKTKRKGYYHEGSGRHNNGGSNRPNYGGHSHDGSGIPNFNGGYSHLGSGKPNYNGGYSHSGSGRPNDHGGYSHEGSGRPNDHGGYSHEGSGGPNYYGGYSHEGSGRPNYNGGYSHEGSGRPNYNGGYFNSGSGKPVYFNNDDDDDEWLPDCAYILQTFNKDVNDKRKEIEQHTSPLIESRIINIDSNTVKRGNNENISLNKNDKKMYFNKKLGYESHEFLEYCRSFFGHVTCKFCDGTPWTSVSSSTSTNPTPTPSVEVSSMNPTLSTSIYTRSTSPSPITSLSPSSSSSLSPTSSSSPPPSSSSTPCLRTISSLEFHLSTTETDGCTYIINQGEEICSISLLMQAFNSDYSDDCDLQSIQIESIRFCGAFQRRNVTLPGNEEGFWTLELYRRRNISTFSIVGQQIPCDSGNTENPEFRTTTAESSSLSTSTGIGPSSSPTSTAAEDYDYDYENIPTPARIFA